MLSLVRSYSVSHASQELVPLFLFFVLLAVCIAVASVRGTVAVVLIHGAAVAILSIMVDSY